MSAGTTLVSRSIMNGSQQADGANSSAGSHSIASTLRNTHAEYGVECRVPCELPHFGTRRAAETGRRPLTSSEPPPESRRPGTKHDCCDAKQANQGSEHIEPIRSESIQDRTPHEGDRNEHSAVSG